MKPVLKQWSFDAEGRLWGNVWYHSNYPLDTPIRTAKVVKLDKGEATTTSGTVYILGCPINAYEESALEDYLDFEKAEKDANNPIR